MELLRIVKARQDGSSGAATVFVKATSPWAAYERIYYQVLGNGDLVLVVEALAHLEKMGLQHGRLSCSCVLLHPSGRVKLSNAWSHPLANAALIRMLGGQEDCRPLGRKKDLVDLGYTMMELMQGYVKEGANLGLDDPEQWDSDVVGFLSATTTASSAAELSEVGLPQHRINLSSQPLMGI
ncbi:uncharacterized protein CLUP02_01841 [Colletotrichum lupini]|uniref:Protein kinase domain-containing protein n=1 Tax=Colletotrichum lupini TaxID=145971 RepID=A0A9Q8W928_9PEZI|nr:uncharacterized protein CLUP02_01841 [Colletotrichum lupini]UQC75188.1 hypothetical protein CLUP02_01841 [Colletotrichum lupini]